MAKGKDFYGTSVTEVIARACKELSASQEDLDIEVLETGSAGIFGLCKKKARIRVTKKSTKKSSGGEKAVRPEEQVPEGGSEAPGQKEAEEKQVPSAEQDRSQVEAAEMTEVKGSSAPKQEQAAPSPPAADPREPVEPARRELPSDEVLATIKEDICGLLEVMTFPSEVTVEVVDYTIACRISGDHEEALVGNEGRTLDSLQYLLRKMMSRRLPDRMMLSLDVGNYREQRAEDLKKRALELAEQVKADGKTQAIPALNPSERRVVHMILQEDKAIRSRSVGEGLFKKVLIYKPGKKKKSGPRKGKGRQGGRSSSN